MRPETGALRQFICISVLRLRHEGVVVAFVPFLKGPRVPEHDQSKARGVLRACCCCCVSGVSRGNCSWIRLRPGVRSGIPARTLSCSGLIVSLAGLRGINMVRRRILLYVRRGFCPGACVVKAWVCFFSFFPPLPFFFFLFFSFPLPVWAGWPTCQLDETWTFLLKKNMLKRIRLL